jgi:Zn-dependent protease
VLWSIAAGPLVNVALVPVLSIALALVQPGAGQELTDPYRWLMTVCWINLALLIFNILPVYPLDGGQILQALLWFPLGEIRSLQIASMIGLIGAIILAAWALLSGIMEPFWVAVMGFFLISRAIAGWQYAKAMVAEKKARETEVPPDFPRV